MTTADRAREILATYYECAMPEISDAEVKTAVIVIEALSQGQQGREAVAVGEVIGYGRVTGEAQVKLQNGLPPGCKLYTAPPAPSDAVREAMEFAADTLRNYRDTTDPECICEDCPECGLSPDRCSGTTCAATCQCSACDHCQTVSAIAALEAALAAQPVSAQCCMCGAAVDTRENGTPGAQLTDGRWTCSESCWERAAQPVVGDGFVMVPRELTDPMFNAWLMNLSVSKKPPKPEKLHELATSWWNAMLTAAQGQEGGP